MKQRLIEKKTLHRCRAVVKFTNGMRFTRTTPWSDQQNGFDGGHWGVYPHLRESTVKEIHMMQKDYGAPAASITFYKEVRKQEVVEQSWDSEQFYAERKVEVP